MRFANLKKLRSPKEKNLSIIASLTKMIYTEVERSLEHPQEL
jgi:hypothetical protein